MGANADTTVNIVSNSAYFFCKKVRKYLRKLVSRSDNKYIFTIKEDVQILSLSFKMGKYKLMQLNQHQNKNQVSCLGQQKLPVMCLDTVSHNIVVWISAVLWQIRVSPSNLFLRKSSFSVSVYVF